MTISTLIQHHDFLAIHIKYVCFIGFAICVMCGVFFLLLLLLCTNGVCWAKRAIERMRKINNRNVNNADTDDTRKKAENNKTIQG